MVHPRKVACSVTAVALSSMLVFPSAAFGATYVNVGGSRHTSAASGEGWSWDGGDNMTLTDYRGGSIIAEGDLVLNLVGGNIVVASTSSDAGIEVVSGDLNSDGRSSQTATLDIVGKGSL